MEAVLQDLIAQANATSLNLLTALTSKDELLALDTTLGRLEEQMAAVRARLAEEEHTLQLGIAAASDIIQKVKGRPLASAMKGSRNVTYTPNPVSTPGRRMVSFDVKTSSPLSSVISQPRFAASLASAEPASVLAPPCTQIDLLSPEEFDRIPKYMKGRAALDKVNLCVQLLNQLYEEKYAVMSQNPSKLPHELRQRYWDWKELECEEAMHRRFITEADIKAAMLAASTKGSAPVFKLDPLGRSVLAILRHHGRIREVRTPGVVRFVIL